MESTVQEGKREAGGSGPQGEKRGSWEIRSTRRKERISEENFIITSFQTHFRDEKFTKR